MKSFFAFAFTLFIFLNSSSQNPHFDATRLLDIKKWITTDVEKGELQGATVLIADKEKILYSYTGGVSNIATKRPLLQADYFKIASMTKVVTTVAVMQLYEKGMFDLDDPIAQYLPEFENLQVLRPDVAVDSLVPATQKMTIRHLLNQTSGYAYGGPKISKWYKRHDIHFFAPKARNLEAFIKKLAQMPLVAQPGEKFTYGPSTDILGYLIEQVSGLTLDVYFRENVWRPLGTQHTGFNLPKMTENALVRTYKLDEEGKLVAIPSPDGQGQKHSTSVFMGGSGLISTAKDYLIFCQMLLNHGTYNGNTLLSRKSIELMTQNQTVHIDYPQRYHRLLGEDNTFGFGVNVVTEAGSRNELYTVGSYFWEGSYTTSFIVDPKEGFTAVLMTQIGGSKSLELRKTFRKLVYRALQ